MQYFKGDDIEKKFYESGKPALDNLSLAKDDFLAGAYGAGPLGDMIFTSGRSPLANAIRQSIFRISFKEIFDSFVKVGTFEAYIAVFKKIFGENVVVTFTVPAPGKLQINIQAEGIELSNFIVRRIENNVYINDLLVDEVGDFIVLQTIKGFQSQYELEQMLFEMVPNGIYTEITLVLEE